MFCQQALWAFFLAMIYILESKLLWSTAFLEYAALRHWWVNNRRLWVHRYLSADTTDRGEVDKPLSVVFMKKERRLWVFYLSADITDSRSAELLSVISLKFYIADFEYSPLCRHSNGVTSSTLCRILPTD